MPSLTNAQAARTAATTSLDWRGGIHSALPGLALLAMYLWMIVVQPNALGYTGLQLIFSSAVPLLFATVAQMFIIMLGDIDLGIGHFVGLVNVIVATYLVDQPLVCLVLFGLLVASYMAMGALIQIRRIPAIIVTLGASFVWLGVGLAIRSVPGGVAPDWLGAFSSGTPPVIPLPLLEALVVAVAAYLLTEYLPYGVVLRGAGSNPLAVERSGWSLIKARVTCYGLAGAFGILSGLAVTALTGSGDATASADYTLLSIAAVVLGGGTFAGGVAVPFGAVIGALAISLVGSLLAVLNVSSDYQTGVQGLILVLVLAGRTVIRSAAE